MPDPTIGFGGRILSVEETDEGTTPTDPNYIKFSDIVTNVELTFDPNNQDWRDIGDYDVAQFTRGMPAFGLRVSYLLHEDRGDQVTDAIDRLSNNDMQSYSIEVAAGRDDTNPGYYTFKGAKPDSVTVSGEVGNPTEIEITYQCLDVDPAAAEPDLGLGTRETAALGDLSLFSTSSIERDGSPVAFITRSAEFTVSHNLTPEGTDGQRKPKKIFAGTREVTGSVDITVDDGGVALVNDVLNGDEGVITFKLGSAGAPKFETPVGRWDALTIPLDSTEGFVQQSVGFRGKGITTGAVA